MKKLFGVLLATIILLTSATLPVYAVMEEDNDDSRIDIGEIFGYAYTVTFNDGTNITEIDFYENENIVYPALTANRDYDNVWSLSADEYIAPPKTMPKEDITIYSYKSPIIGFENYASADYANTSMAVGVSDEYAFSGEKSLKYSNSHYSVVLTKPTDWDVSFNNYYTKNNEGYVKNAFDTAPEFVSGKFYNHREYAREHSAVLGSVSQNTAYKIKFKYYVSEPLKTQHYFIPFTGYYNMWAAGNEESGKYVEYRNSQFNIPADTKTGEWLDGEVYFTASQYTFGEYTKLYLMMASKTLDLGDVIYFDDFSVEEVITADFIIPAGFTVNSKNGTLIGNTFTAYYDKDAVLTAPEVLTSDGTPVIWVDEDKLVVTEFKANGIYSIKLDAKGDLNGDGAVSILDLAVMKLYLVESIELDSFNTANADINGNGTVDIADMAYLKLYLAGLVEIY